MNDFRTRVYLCVRTQFSAVETIWRKFWSLGGSNNNNNNNEENEKTFLSHLDEDDDSDLASHIPPAALQVRVGRGEWIGEIKEVYWVLSEGGSGSICATESY